jgi:hypothetical protein
MATVYYSYSPVRQPLGQPSDEATREFTEALLSTQRAEKELRQRYAEILTWANSGSVPGVVVRDYIEAALHTNNLLHQNQKLYEAAGGTAPVTTVPMIRSRRNFTDQDVLSLADLAFDPCPQAIIGEQPLEGLGWAQLIPYIGRAIVIGAVGWTAGKIGSVLTTNKDDIARYNTIAKQAESLTIRQGQIHAAFGREMDRCAGSDASRYEECAKKVSVILTDLNKSLPKGEKVGAAGGLGLLGWIGVIALFGLGGAGVYVWHSRRSARQDTEPGDED